MYRVWKSRGRAGPGFRQSGSGSGRVFAYFESRVRVLPCRVSGFGRVSNLWKKGTNFGKNHNYFLTFQTFNNFSSNFKKSISLKKVKKQIFSCVKKFLVLFLTKKVDFWTKIAVFNPYKTLRVSSGFDSRVRVWFGLTLKSRVRGRAGLKQSGVGFQAGFRVPWYITSLDVALQVF